MDTHACTHMHAYMHAMAYEHFKVGSVLRHVIKLRLIQLMLSDLMASVFICCVLGARITGAVVSKSRNKSIEYFPKIHATRHFNVDLLGLHNVLITKTCLTSIFILKQGGGGWMSV